MTNSDRKRQMLKEGLSAPRPIVSIGAHDAMSSSLVEGYGFDAVWVSGFGVSTMSHAIPDMNLITMTEALAAATAIDSATNLPVVADCDNGFGGLINVVRTVREYERAGIAGICVEDNLFPKRNSLYAGSTKRELIPLKEQVRRIKAAKEAQQSEDFVFIGRVESLIAGHGVTEAVERAEAYAEAGSDALLIHSRDKTLSEIEGFLERWSGKTPLVAVPTLFPDYTADELYRKGFQMIILANQLMRASVQAMEATLKRLSEHRKAAVVDPEIATVSHIFDLVRTKEHIALQERGEDPNPANELRSTPCDTRSSHSAEAETNGRAREHQKQPGCIDSSR